MLAYGLVAVALVFAAAYAAVAVAEWATRSRSGRVFVVALRIVRFAVVLVAVGAALFAIAAVRLCRAAKHRRGATAGLDALTAPRRWRARAGRISPKLADDPGHVDLRTGWTPTPSGGVFHVRLPAGVTPDDLDPDRVASVFRATSALVTPGRRGHEAHVRIRRVDTLADPIPAPPAAWTGPVLTIGVDEDGEPLRVDLTISHAAMGGASRAGKSTTLHTVIGAFAANPDAALYLLDGKEGAELGAWRRRATAFDAGDDDDPTRPLALLCDVLELVKTRNRDNAQAGRQKSGDHHPPVLVVVDEAATYSARVKGFDHVLADVMRRGLAVNVVVILATQKATADAIPTVLRDLCETRIAFKVSSREMGVAILGEQYGRYAAALPSVVADPHRNAGRCIVTAGGDVRYGRTFHATAAWIADAAQTARRPTTLPAAGGGGDAPARTPARGGAGAPAPGRAHERARETRADRRERNRAAHAARRAANPTTEANR